MSCINPVCYQTVSPCVGRHARMRMNNGKVYTGKIAAVRPDGILFHSSNPGFIFAPFFAVAALALTLPFLVYPWSAGYARGYTRGFARGYTYPVY